jgi:hypothetical protein
MKTKNKILTAVAVIAVSIIILVAVSFEVFKHATVKNVFDEMYYASFRNQIYNSAFLTKTSTRFGNVKQYIIPKITKDDSYEYGIDFIYKDEYSDGSIRVNILYYDEPSINIYFVKYGDDNESDDYIRCCIRYFVSKRILVMESVEAKVDITDTSQGKIQGASNEVENFMQKYSLTRDDIRDMQRELFDRIVTDWCEGNEGLTRFSLDNPGKFIVEDNTFDMPE